MANLTVVAHEMGHILWWDKNVVNEDCWKNSFKKHWSTTDSQHFKIFVQPDNNKNSTHEASLIDIVDLSQTNAAAAANLLWRIYHNSNFVSLFASVAPEEDFAEMYKVLALTKATTPLRSLTFQIRNVSSPTSTPVSLVINSVLNTTGTQKQKAS